MATPRSPRAICTAPASRTAATRYSTPYFFDTEASTSAVEPVAAEIIARRPPTIEIVTAIVKEAKSPTRGSTSAITEKEIASGIRAMPTTIAARISIRQRAAERHQSVSGTVLLSLIAALLNLVSLG